MSGSQDAAVVHDGVYLRSSLPFVLRTFDLSPAECAEFASAFSDVIEEAAVRQTTYLRSYQVGAHAADCTRILNEIAQARLGPGLGAVVGVGILVAVYLAGGPGAPLLGRGEGQLAAGTFLGASLIVAGIRADPGCEVMAIPGVLFGKHMELACLVFSPLDWLERKWQSKRAA